MIRMNDENIKAAKRDEKLEREIEKALDELLPDSKKSSQQTYAPEQDNLAQMVRDKYNEVKRNRTEVTERWLKDLRQYRGQYDPEVLARIHPKRSKAFIRATRTKVKTVDSRLVDLLFPANGDKNWSIKSTTIPEINNNQLQGILSTLQQSGAEQITREMFDTAVKNFADQQAKKMEKVIDDQLQEARYRDVLRDVIHSGNLYGTGILKGPMISVAKGRQYKQVQDEFGNLSWKLETFDELMPYIEQVTVWDFFPDMTSTSISDCRYIIQRHKMTKKQLLDLSKRSDFLAERVREYVGSQQEGDWKDEDHDTQLRSIGEHSVLSRGHEKASRKYEILEFWGYVDSSDLSEMGVDIPEEFKADVEIAANIWVVGNTIIKAAVSHLNEIQWPFFLYYYDKDETSIFGEGIPAIMRDPQELTNSAFRAMLDHAAITAGPQIEVNMDLLAENEDPTDVYPFKVWMRTGGPDATAEAVRVTTMPSYTAEYLQMCQAIGNYADEVTTIPRYMWGEAQPGIARTSSGLSMLMGSANITLKDQVKNFDDGITKPFITAMYHWNMKFNDDESVKGDYNIRAEGTASLVAKEVYANSLMQFAQLTANGMDAPMIKRSSILRAIADSLDLGDKNLVMSDQEIQAGQQQQMQQAKQEREFMLRMTEVARQYGTSPNDMIENMRLAYADKTEAMQGR